jgi:peptidoglycan biosynthesis protein MviN/MurJ (putative lipid II flippase)
LVIVRDMALMIALAAPGFVLLGAFGGSVRVVILALVLAVGFGYAWSGLFNLVVVRVWHTTPASATGVTQTGLWAGATLGPLLFGFIAEHTYALAWYVGGAFVFAGAMCLAMARHVLARRELTTRPLS